MSDPQSNPAQPAPSTDATASLNQLEKELAEGSAGAAPAAESGKAPSAAAPAAPGAADAGAHPAPAAHGASSAGPAKGAAVRKLFGKLHEAWIAPTLEMTRSTLSPDRPTRRMSAIWLLSCLGILLVVGRAVQHSIALRRAALPSASEVEEQERKASEVVKKQAEDAKRKSSIIMVGNFVVELKNPSGAKLPATSLKTAELEIVVECDSPETRAFIEGHTSAVKSELTSVLTALDREELLSPEGKRRLKRKITEKLNLWLKSGKIQEVFFSKLLMES